MLEASRKSLDNSMKNERAALKDKNDAAVQIIRLQARLNMKDHEHTLELKTRTIEMQGEINSLKSELAIKTEVLSMKDSSVHELSKKVKELEKSNEKYRDILNHYSKKRINEESAQQLAQVRQNERNERQSRTVDALAQSRQIQEANRRATATGFATHQNESMQMLSHFRSSPTSSVHSSSSRKRPGSNPQNLFMSSSSSSQRRSSSNRRSSSYLQHDDEIKSSDDEVSIIGTTKTAASTNRHHRSYDSDNYE